MNGKNPPHFIILVDALRHDYISEKNTPFLFALKTKSFSAKVLESYAFQTRPCYFAGLEPEDSSICHLYEYNPEQSPFAFLRPASGALQIIERMGLGKYLRGFIRRAAKKKALSLGHPAAAAVMGTEQIPLHLLPFFALSEKQFSDDEGVYGDRQSIFDIFRKQGRTWAWIGYPRHFGSTTSILKAYREHPDTDIAYLHFSELDWTGHRYGPNAPELQEKLAQIDATLQDLLEPAIAAGKNVVVFGDHGMVEVQYHIDLLSELETLALKVPEDYLYFLDSTQARFWFFSEQAEQQIRHLLENFKGGKILEDPDRERLHIRFKDRRYGDLIYGIDGPGIIHPSFFGRTGEGPKGMHGYPPEVEDNATQILVLSENVQPDELKAISMVEIYGLLKRSFQ